MTGEPLLALAPLRIERWALGRALPARCTGMGRAPSLRAGLGDAAGRAVVVVGFGGALDGRLRAGDVVVATEVRDGDGPTTATTAPERLAAELDRVLTTRVHTGPLLTTPRIVHGDARAAHAATGALAVDMESAYLLAGATTAAARGAVRVVVDTPQTPLSHPRTVAAGAAAIRSLRLLAPGLRTWAAAVTGSTTPTGAEV